MRWLRRFARRTHAETDLDAEITFHLEEEVRLRVERGETPAQARAAARRLFGNVAMVQETTRDVWAWARLASAWRGVSLIIRSFTQAKGFAAAAMLTVALGIGVNTLVFSLFDRVLFRPLPYSEPHRLVQLQSRLAGPSPPPLNGAPTLNLAVTQALAREKDLFSGMAWAIGGTPQPMTPVSGENPLLWLTAVTTGALEVLGVRPAIGPGFSAVGANGGTELPVLLTYETWQHRYGGSDDVLSLAWTAHPPNAFATNKSRWRVVGVLPQGFLLPSPNLVRTQYDGIYGVDPGLDRSVPSSQIDIAPFARLAPGVSIAAAQARIDALVASTFPQSAPSYRYGVTARPLQSGLSVTVRPYAWLVVAGAWAVLGVTCLTLAILLLTWSHSRRQDAAVRLALGASPRRLVVTALLESTLLCGAGAVIGWLAYAWARTLFVSVLPAGLRPFAAETVDLRVIAATSGTALVSAIVAGTLPAIRTSRTAPLDVLRAPQHSARLDRLVGGPVLLSLQAAFGVILLVGASATVPGVLGFLLKSPGFEATDLFVVHVPSASDDKGRLREDMRRRFAVLDVLRGLPGVVGAGLSATDPFSSGSTGNHPFWTPRGLDGRELAVGAGFFKTLAAPMLAGRAFSPEEVEQQALVAIVNETGAQALWPDLPVGGVIGQAVTTHDGPRVVVGVVADMRIGVEAHPDPGLFLPVTANETYRPGSLCVLLRMAHGRVPDRMLLLDRLREQSLIPPNTRGRVQSVKAQLEPALEKPKLLAVVFGTLAGITLLLTTIALYGLANFDIRRRGAEMTVRLALGATPQALRRRLGVVTVRPVILGVLIGLPVSWVGARLLGASVPLVNAGDLRIYAAATAAMLFVALVAAWMPGRRLSTMRVSELLRSS